MVELKNRLLEGQVLFGTMVTLFDNPDIARILNECGFDFFIVDCEHGYFDFSSVAKIIAVARGVGIPALVRIPEPRREVILKYMEMGANGLLLPQAETVEQAKALVKYSKYRDLGNRGVSLTRPHTGFKKIKPLEYVKKANEATMLLIQIESPEGVSNIEEMMDVEGIDGAIIGPNDLTMSMGIIGQRTHPEYTAAINRVIQVANKKKKFSGIHLSSTDEVKEMVLKGMQMNLWSSDVGMLMSSARNGLEKLRS